jgi:hypothetical protein
MTIPMHEEPGRRPRVDAGQLWAGGAATAIVAALVALAGILICRWLFSIPILAPSRDGAWGDASSGEYVVAAAAAAIVATAILYLLAVAAPRPGTFFAWIIGLITLVAVVFPVSTTAPLAQKAATAIVNLALGIAIGSLLSGVAARAMRVQLPSGDYAQPRPPTRPPARTPDDPWR